MHVLLTQVWSLIVFLKDGYDVEDIEDGSELDPPQSPTVLAQDSKKPVGIAGASQAPIDPLKKLKSIASAPKDSRLKDIVKEKPKRPGTAPPADLEEDEYKVYRLLSVATHKLKSLPTNRIYESLNQEPRVPLNPTE